MSDVKKLYRSTTDKQLSGVCGGIAEYAHVDSTLVRIAWVLMTLVTGFVPGAIAYIAFIFIIPTKDEKDEEKR